ncbi:MAG TPA: hypothetical protein VG387_11870 [Rhizomicrobium sp.]|jgi:hypothetical protein|nr:hypothetical protein [Rhizomicrobium sp.]
MAPKNRGRTRNEAPERPDPLAELDRFLVGFVDLTALTSKALLEQATSPDDKVVIEAYSLPLNQQVARLAAFVRDAVATASAPTQAGVSNLLHLFAATQLVESGRALTANLSAMTARIALSDIVALIKKIINAIFNDFFGGVTKWLTSLEEIIDEIINFLLSAGILKLANTLSIRHQNYMAELTQLENLMHARAWRNGGEDDEE